MEEFVHSTMQQFGVFGIGLLMFLENIFPPIPSELIMPLAGYLSTRGDMSIVAVIAAGSTGSLLGIIPWYVLGRMMGEKKLKSFAGRHGRWLTMSPDDIAQAGERFRRHGQVSVLIGRLIPTVRTLISVPAGIARMPFWQFLAYSAIGSVIWTSALALAGFGLGQAYETVKDYVNPVATAVLCIMIVAYGYRVATFKA
ncbi:membrane protein DedA with SNARE-associated domain [Rhizobium subbaraonis]|uniref:Membrane protein DedA with SNARE-associated domain n=1 Tax=Rhizobium subbaraonis TaxID=908946 RepID=A0A285UET5_9HYPH|nr:DedA family protein [Rhizobium subbaraonis]SOC40390.1 membrane protein DedA with SNARE-associated domain [Rhizobium subbaraonis]